MTRVRRLAGDRRAVWVLVALAGLAVAIAVGVWLRIRQPERPPLALGSVPHAGEGFAAALAQTTAAAMRGGHAVTLLQDAEVFDAAVREIDGAVRSVHLQQYIWVPGQASTRLVAALVRRAAAGVECRILVDAFGSPDFLEELAPDLQTAGCEVRMFRDDVELARGHRKLLVVDGIVALTGGFGVRDEWVGGDEPPWRDTAITVRGPAVADAQRTFARAWIEAGGEPLPAHAFPEQPRAGQQRVAFVASTGAPVLTHAEALMQLLASVPRERLWITNAYFVPSPAINRLLALRAAAGVDVRVLTAGMKSDSKTSWGAQQTGYDELLEHGVRVFEYESTMIHAKTALVDDTLALVGTINLDPLSLSELDEDAFLVEDRAINAELAARFLADCEQAEEVEP